jgi:hypothetical protein
VIAPESGEGIKKQTGLPVLLRNTLLVSALIFCALEFWRPYFFLTDDNLDFRLPNFTEIGNNLLSGRSPFVSGHLFGGHYDFLGDPTYFCVHPLYLAASLLAATPFHFAIIDVDAFVFFMIATAGFVVLADHLRRELSLTISDGWIMFYALSFTYSMIALTAGASWLDYLGNQSAFPWLALGILQKTWRRGIGLVALFSLHQIMGGNFSPLVTTSIFFTLFALGVSLSRRSIVPLGAWLAGYALAVAVVLPLLLPTIEGFFASARDHGVTLEEMQANNLSFAGFPTALFSGMALWMINSHPHPTQTYTMALGSSAAVWCLLPALVSRAKWRPLEVVSLGMMFFGLILICRPVWISEVMLQLPVLRSIRWPFREFLQFQFFLHLFLLLRQPGLSKRTRVFMACLGTGLMVIPMALFPNPPTFNPMAVDRELLFSGGFYRYWDQVRPLLKPSDRIAVIVPQNFYLSNYHEIPYSLLGTYNYSELDGVINASGYSATAPDYQLYTKTYAAYANGAYLPDQKAALMTERPDLKFITLESVHPLKITLSSRDGPTIDLSPYVPAKIPRR